MGREIKMGMDMTKKKYLGEVAQEFWQPRNADDGPDGK